MEKYLPELQVLMRSVLAAQDEIMDRFLVSSQPAVNRHVGHILEAVNRAYDKIVDDTKLSYYAGSLNDLLNVGEILLDLCSMEIREGISIIGEQKFGKVLVFVNQLVHNVINDMAELNLLSKQ